MKTLYSKLFEIKNKIYVASDINLQYTIVLFSVPDDFGKPKSRCDACGCSYFSLLREEIAKRKFTQLLSLLLILSNKY